MKLRLDRTRMAMEGCVYSYDCVVPVSEVNREQFSYFILRDGGEYVLFSDATRPAALDAMPRGFERYDAFMEHYKACRDIAWKHVQDAFPELQGVQSSGLVELPGFDAQHAVVYTEVAA